MLTRLKLFHGFLLSAVLLAIPDKAQAQLTFTTNNGTITITGYTGSTGAVTIPSTINGIPVSDIGAWAFQQCSSLTAVTISNGVTSIGGDAFWSCVNLGTVVIPSSVTNIGNGAFFHCDSLTEIAVDSPNTSFSSLNGVLFDKGLKTLLQCPGGKAGSYTIPDSVTNIGEWGFYGCTSLTNVTIPDSVMSIGYDAFYFCSGLTNVTIPDSVISIGDYAFNECRSLTNVSIGSNVISIGSAAFYECSSLTGVAIPDGVANIGDYAFNYCISLAQVTIPDSVTNIGKAAFNPCYNLTAINVSVSNPFYCSVDGVLFNYNRTTLIQCPGTKAGKYVIPNTVNCVGYEAFAFCPNLTSVVVPTGVTNIASQAFVYSTALKGVYFQGNAPSIVGLAVFYPNTNATIYYSPGTSGWGAKFASLPTAAWFLPNPLILSSGPGFGLQSNGFGFRISWATNVSATVDVCTNLAFPNWSPVGTNALTNGWSYFSDAEWTNYPSRFYRIRSP